MGCQRDKASYLLYSLASGHQQDSGNHATLVNQQVEGRGNFNDEQARKNRAYAVKQRKAASLCKLERELLLELSRLITYFQSNKQIGKQWFCLLC